MVRLHLAVLTSALCFISAVAKGERPITANDLARVADIVGLTVSPHGTKVAYVVRRADPQANAYAQDWYVVPTTTGAAVLQVADGGETELHVFGNGQRAGVLAAPIARWSPGGAWLAFTRTQHGETQLWQVAADGTRLEQLTHNAADVQDFVWSDDGSRIYFVVDRARGFTEEMDRVDGRDGYLVSEPMPALPDMGRTNWPRCVAQPLPRGLAPPSERLCVRTLWVYGLMRGEERLATEAEQAAQEALIENVNGGWRPAVERHPVSSPDGRRCALLENPDPKAFPGVWPPTRLATAMADKTGRVSCRAEACTGFKHDAVWWGPGSDEVFLLKMDGPAYATQSLYGWRPGEAQVRTVLRSDENRLSNCQSAGARLICVRQGWSRPDHVVAVDLKSGAVEAIADPNKDFRYIAFTAVEQLTYDDGLGVKTYGHLVYPADYEKGRRYPVVVVQYRTGGFLRGATGDEQPIPVYARNGIFVLSTNRPEDDLIHATISDFRQANAADWADNRIKRRGLRAILRALDELDARGLIDPNRMGITGLSNGASISEQALVSTNRFAAVSVAYLNYSPFSYYNFPDRLSRLEMSLHGHSLSDQGLAHYRELSSGLVALFGGKDGHTVNEPILIQVADREYHLTLQNYVDLVDAGRAVEMNVFPDEYHIKWQPAHRLAIYQRNIDWMNFWLRGVEESDPMKTQQYVRWRAMRDNQCRLLTGADAPWYCRQ